MRTRERLTFWISAKGKQTGSQFRSDLVDLVSIFKLGFRSEGRTMAENTSKSSISRRNWTMPYLSRYSISHGGQSLMGHDMHRPI